MGERGGNDLQAARRENRILPFIVGGESNASDGERGFGPDEECLFLRCALVPWAQMAIFATGASSQARLMSAQDMTDLRT